MNHHACQVGKKQVAHDNITPMNRHACEGAKRRWPMPTAHT
jgi:hypothetical protein